MSRDPFGFPWAVSTVRQAMTLDELADRTPPEMTDNSSGDWVAWQPLDD